MVRSMPRAVHQACAARDAAIANYARPRRDDRIPFQRSGGLARPKALAGVESRDGGRPTP